MSEQVRVVPMAEHEYGVEISEGGTVTGHRVRVDEQLVDDLGIVDLDEQRLVEETIAFLLERMPAAAIDREVGLDAVTDRFDDYVPEIRARLTR
ncbi:MAG TPA: hypothetical protein VKP64_00890 [Mycobacteriales bacterium]|nr:hypothetical protein [Mycobacteriales bacterium]